MTSEALEGVRGRAKAWAFSIQDPASAAIAGYLTELLRWNARVNLTGARGLDDLVLQHLDDSFALARLVPVNASVIDVGSGGGLPAVPLAILRPDLTVVLVEPRAKRVAFLRSIVRLAPSMSVEHARWEEIDRRGFDVAMSRATFSPEEWLPVGRQLVSPTGLVFVLAANSVDATRLGARLDAELAYSTAHGHGRWIGGFRFA
jgi:16S rRNA (guanine527-N7)-methyltransferase